MVKIPSRSRVILIIAYYFFSWERGFSIDSGSTGPVGSHRRCIMNKQSQVRKHTHCLATLWRYMAYDHMTQVIFYEPSIVCIRSHRFLCASIILIWLPVYSTVITAVC